jgi:hypothetical protein
LLTETRRRSTADLGTRARTWAHQAGEAAALADAAAVEIRRGEAGAGLALAALHATQRRMRALWEELHELAAELADGDTELGEADAEQ